MAREAPDGGVESGAGDRRCGDGDCPTIARRAREFQRLLLRAKIGYGPHMLLLGIWLAGAIVQRRLDPLAGSHLKQQGVNLRPGQNPSYRSVRANRNVLIISTGLLSREVMRLLSRLGPSSRAPGRD